MHNGNRVGQPKAAAYYLYSGSKRKLIINVLVRIAKDHLYH